MRLVLAALHSAWSWQRRGAPGRRARFERWHLTTTVARLTARSRNTASSERRLRTSRSRLRRRSPRRGGSCHSSCSLLPVGTPAATRSCLRLRRWRRPACPPSSTQNSLLTLLAGAYRGRGRHARTLGPLLWAAAAQRALHRAARPAFRPAGGRRRADVARACGRRLRCAVDRAGHLWPEPLLAVQGRAHRDAARSHGARPARRSRPRTTSHAHLDRQLHTRCAAHASHVRLRRPRSLVAGLCLQVATTHFIAAAANFSVPRILSAHGFLGVALALLVPG